MAIHFTSTNVLAQSRGVKVITYGLAGSGKTHLVATAPRPMLFSAESGTLSIAKYGIPMAEVCTYQDLQDALRWSTTSAEASNYDTICLDSISEMAERILNIEKTKTKDPRKAYGEMMDQIAVIFRSFRDTVHKNVYMSCKCALRDVPDEANPGVLTQQWHPMMPGKQTAQAIPYLFDEMLFARVREAPDHENVGKSKRWHELCTRPTMSYEAKDRSGVLAEIEYPHLGEIFRKICTGTSLAAPGT